MTRGSLTMFKMLVKSTMPFTGAQMIDSLLPTAQGSFQIYFEGSLVGVSAT